MIAVVLGNRKHIRLARSMFLLGLLIKDSATWGFTTKKFSVYPFTMCEE